MQPLNLLTSTSLQLNAANMTVLESRQKFLRFALGSGDRGMLSLEQIVEVISVTCADILPVPEMPNCVLGIYNWRGKMLWLIDLNHLVDYPPLVPLDRHTPLMAMVIEIKGHFIGLVVEYVKDIELHDAQQLQPATADLFPPRLLPFVAGYLPDANGIVLNTQAIALCPLWQIHRA